MLLGSSRPLSAGGRVCFRSRFGLSRHHLPQCGEEGETLRNLRLRSLVACSVSSAQSHPVTLKVDLGDLHCDQLAFADELGRGLNRLVGQL